jgi:hypothetical protein
LHRRVPRDSSDVKWEKLLESQFEIIETYPKKRKKRKRKRDKKAKFILLTLTNKSIF